MDNTAQADFCDGKREYDFDAASAGDHRSGSKVVRRQRHRHREHINGDARPGNMFCWRTCRALARPRWRSLFRERWISINKRMQFTPDVMPSDITGYTTIQTGGAAGVYVPAPQCAISFSRM
jgi:hypothetical protein